MNTPRKPNGPVLVGGAGDDAGRAPEPFVRLSTLAPSDGAAAQPTTYEERTGALIRQALPPEGLDGQTLDRLWERFDGDRQFRGRGPIGSSLRWALVVGVLLMSGGFVGAETGAWTWPRTIVRKLVGISSPAPVSPRAPGRVRARRESAPTVEPAAVEPVVAEPARGTGLRRPAEVRPRGLPLPMAVAPPPAVERSALAEESAMLGRALARLRQERDATGALVELDRYSARFPSAVLGHEAERARVDALLMTGRLAEARTILGKLTLGNGARDRELRLIRAELVAEQGCGRALGDYEIVLTESEESSLSERALWGRAACRARLGDEAGARRDLAAYLARFPQGAHAAAARARLGS